MSEYSRTRSDYEWRSLSDDNARLITERNDLREALDAARFNYAAERDARHRVEQERDAAQARVDRLNKEADQLLRELTHARSERESADYRVGLHQRTIVTLKAENGRLRDALLSLVEWDSGYGFQHNVGLARVIKEARAALGEREEGEQ